EFVDVGNAGGPLRFPGVESLGARAHAMAVQVIAVGNLEADLDAVARRRGGLHLESLLDRQQVVGTDALRVGRTRQQPEGKYHETANARGPHQARGLPAVSAAIQSRYAGRPPSIPMAITSGTS